MKAIFSHCSVADIAGRVRISARLPERPSGSWPLRSSTVREASCADRAIGFALDREFQHIRNIRAPLLHHGVFVEHAGIARAAQSYEIEKIVVEPCRIHPQIDRFGMQVERWVLRRCCTRGGAGVRTDVVAPGQSAEIAGSSGWVASPASAARAPAHRHDFVERAGSRSVLHGALNGFLPRMQAAVELGTGMPSSATCDGGGHSRCGCIRCVRSVAAARWASCRLA